jgi:uncharacterized protein (DUF2267 family)
MKFDEFMKRVQERADISDRGDAERAAITVLQNLCDRLTGDEADDLLAQLPYQLKTAVIVSPSAQRISPDEFVQRVASSLDVDPTRRASASAPSSARSERP